MTETNTVGRATMGAKHERAAEAAAPELVELQDQKTELLRQLRQANRLGLKNKNKLVSWQLDQLRVQLFRAEQTYRANQGEIY